MAFCVLLYATAGKTHIMNSTVYGVAYIINHSSISKDKTMKFFGEDNKEHHFKVSSYKSISSLNDSLSEIKSSALISAFFAFAIAFILAFFLFRFFAKYHDSKDGKHLRGGELVDEEILKKIIIDSGNESDIKIGSLPIDSTKEGRHFMATGDTGTGKSQQIMAMLEVIRQRGKKVVIFDKSGEFIQHFYDAERGDKILAPFDSRSEYWSPFAEGTEIFDFERLCFSFIPVPADMDESKKHWPEAAITVFTWFLYKVFLQLGTSAVPDDVFRKFIGKKIIETVGDDGETYQEEVREFLFMLEGTPAELVTDRSSPEHASSVIGSLIPKIRSLWYMRGLEHKPLFSLRDWVNDDSNNGWIFIRASNDQLESVKPLITTWLDTVISGTLSLPKSNEREIWCLIDELQSLDKLASLEKGLFEGRKHGLRMLLGFTSISKLNTIYGPDTVNSIISMCGNKMFFRVSDDKTAERAAKILLEKEVMDENQNISFGTNDNVSANEQRNSRYLVTPSEIMTLEDMVTYVRLPGGLPTTKVKLNYVSRPENSPALVLRKLPVPVDYSSSEIINSPDCQLQQPAAPLI